MPSRDGPTSEVLLTDRTPSVVLTGGSAAFPIRDFLTRANVDFVYRDGEARPASPSARSADGTRLESPTLAELAGHLGLHHTRRRPTPTTWSSWAPDRQVWRPPCTRPRRVLRPPSSSARCPAGRPVRARASRTTSASPTASPASISPSERGARPRSSAPRCSCCARYRRRRRRRPVPQQPLRRQQRRGRVACCARPG